MTALEARLKKLEGKLSPKTPESDYWGQFRNLSFEQFWDKIGRPEKAGREHPIYPYEEQVLQALADHKYIWIKKATGLGITELILRYMAWQALKDDTYQGTLFCIVTGPNEKLAQDLIKRIVDMFADHPPEYTKTEIFLNGVKIQAFPSNHLDALRGQPKVKKMFLDEADFFRLGEQENARAISERYIAKTDPQIIMVSTPNIPDGLFSRMENEEPSIYHKIFLPYTVGLGNIYSVEDIEKAKKSPSFEREYNLKYGYGVGNVFHAEDIDACVKEYDLNGYRHADCKLFIDPAFGLLEQNSKFAFLVLAMVDGKVRVYDAAQFAGLSYNDSMTELDTRLHRFNPVKIGIDGANPVFIRGAKEKVGESPDYDAPEAKERSNWWRVVPMSFGQNEGKAMLVSIQSLVSGHYFEVHPIFEELILQMRMAITKDDGKLDKSKHPMDLFDALRMGAFTYKVQNE